MAQGKVRCVECGAKNTDLLAERCRICGGLLPDAVRRRADRLGAVTSGLVALASRGDISGMRDSLPHSGGNLAGRTSASPPTALRPKGLRGYCAVS